MQRDKRLVGGDDMLAVFQRGQHQFLGRAESADQLDDNVDVRVIDDLEGVGGQADAVGRADAIAAEIAGGGGANLDVAAGAAGDFAGIARQYPDGAAADRAESEYADIDGFQMVFLWLNRNAG